MADRKQPAMGKGDKPRSGFNQKYRDNYDSINWSDKSSFVIGDRVSVIPRFGESGEIVGINMDSPKPYEILFKNLNMTLWYDATELRKLHIGEASWNWFRMPERAPFQNYLTDIENNFNIGL